MDERAARRPNLELVRKDVQLTSSGLVPTTPAGAITASLGIATGVLLDGKYLVGRIIGAGAVGIVFEAKNVELDETVALKCLRPEMLIDPGVVARFAREAKAAAAIKSEYVATVHDVGMTDDGVPFIVMEYLEGKDLGTVVADSGTLSPRSAVEYALHVCEALAVAHSKGIVHRDIKPENLLLTERAGGMRIVKVLDFGISKTALTGSIFQNELPLVKTVNLMGTPLYMSPEQVRVSDSVDVRSDIWSLGMVIYEILTGQTAFAGQSITEICAAILEASPQPIERYRSDLPSGLVEVISKCLQKDVDKRFQNIAELALALAPFGPKRTRLNVERAVAVLQASGHFDPAVRVNSTVPPSPGDFLGQLSIPRAPAVPTTSGIVPAPTSSAPMVASPASEPALASSLPAQGGGTLPGAPADPRRKRIVLAAGALAMLALVSGIVAVTRQGATAAAASGSAPAVVETKPASPQTAALPTSTPTSTPEAATATATAAGIAATPAKPSALPTAPFAHPGLQPKLTAKPVVTSTTPKPKATGKPGDEPDLGY